MAFSVGTISAKVTANTSDFMSKVDAVQRRGSRLADEIAPQMARVGRSLTMGLTLPITGAGAALVKMASDAEETESKFNTVFSNISAQAQTSASVLTKSFGLSQKASQDLLGTTGDLLTGFGFTQESALGLSEEVNKLAVDLASFTNFSGGAEGASQALTKALLGERESVKSLGISILEADVNAKILENTQKGLTFETERQAKAYATLQLAQEQSKNAIGDFARTQDSFANQMRQLTAEASDLAVELGKELLPVAKQLVGGVRSLTSVLSMFSSEAKTTGLAIAGLAAMAGPTIWAVGTLITKFKALKVVMMANPYIAVGAAILAVGTYAWTAQKRINNLTASIENVLNTGFNAQSMEEFNEVIVGIEDRLSKMRDTAKTMNVDPESFESYRELQESLSKVISQRDQLAASKIVIADPQQTSSTADSVERIAQSIDRIRISASQPIDEIIDPAEIANTRVMQEEFAKFNNALYQAQTFSMDFSHRFSHSMSTSSKWMGTLRGIADNFTSSFGQGMSNVVVQGERLVDVLKNIGKLLLSSVIQKGVSILLSGGLGGGGFFGKGGGVLGAIFGGGSGKMSSAVTSASSIASSGSMSEMAMTRAFKSAIDAKSQELTPEAVWIMGEKGRLGV